MKNFGMHKPNEMHPTYTKGLINSSAMPKKIFEPFRTRIDTRNYRYVVDWEIEETEQPEIRSDEENRPRFYFP